MSDMSRNVFGYDGEETPEAPLADRNMEPWSADEVTGLVDRLARSCGQSPEAELLEQAAMCIEYLWSELGKVGA